MSIQQTIEECAGNKPLFRYALGFHYKELEPLLEWIGQTFEVWSIKSLEISPEGHRHIHAYGETHREITKGDKQVFQGKGRLAKYLSKEVTKKWWCKPARKNRYRNIMYVLKDVNANHWEQEVKDLNPTIDDADLTRWCIEAARTNEDIRSKASSFEDRLKEWYGNIDVAERPTTVRNILRRAYTDEVLPWRHFKTSDSVAAAQYLQASKLNPNRIDCINGMLYTVDVYLEKNNIMN